MAKRKSPYPILCLLAILAPSPTKSTIPFKYNESVERRSAVSRQFAKITKFKRDETAKNSPKKLFSPSAQRSYSSTSLPGGDSVSRADTSASAQYRENDIDQSYLVDGYSEKASIKDAQAQNIAQPSSTRSPPSSVAIGIKTGGILPLIRDIIFNSAGPMLRSISFGAQLAIACYLAKASWTIMKEVWEELNEELSFAKGGGKNGGGDVREEQDMPYADQDSFVDGFGGGMADEGDAEGANHCPTNSKRRQAKEFSPQMAATRGLAERLNSAGIPYASEVSAEDIENEDGSAQTVESLVRSLTRAEGNVLSQTLLTPFDGGLLNGSIKNQGGSADFLAMAAADAWNSIGGLAEAKESLLDLAFPLLPPPSLSALPGSEETSESVADYYGGLLSNPPGVLLYGPPGCGKSMLVRALAATVGARFLVVSPACLLRKYVGETNLNVRALFSVARKISPCVIFVDELDGLFRERGGEDHDVGRDLKTEFLQLWDGIRNHSHSCLGGASSPVLVIGATNRPFDVDPAFLRRMPRRVFIGLPDHEARVAVLNSMLQRVPLDYAFDISLVASKTSGYSPSDIREVLQAAALYPLREARAAAISSSHGNGTKEKNALPVRMQIPNLRKLRTNDVLRSLERVKSTQFSKKYQRDLMEYVRNSGGIRSNDTTEYPSVADDFNSQHTQNGEDSDDTYFIADSGTYRGDYYNEKEDSDAYSYDDESSDSDVDDL